MCMRIQSLAAHSSDCWKSLEKWAHVVGCLASCPSLHRECKQETREWVGEKSGVGLETDQCRPEYEPGPTWTVHVLAHMWPGALAHYTTAPLHLLAVCYAFTLFLVWVAFEWIIQLYYLNNLSSFYSDRLLQNSDEICILTMSPNHKSAHTILMNPPRYFMFKLKCE